jgi:ribulose kinase
MDHRASLEADFINSHRPEVLKCTGGTISLEMQTPKLMWLKKNLPESWKAAKYFFDLSDFLTWKATGDDARYFFFPLNRIFFSFETADKIYSIIDFLIGSSVLMDQCKL